MKKVKKRKLNSNKVSGRLSLYFVTMCIIYLVSSVVLKNHNITLNHKLQTQIAINSKLQVNISTMSVKIDELTSFERMSSLASDMGLVNREGTIRNVQ